MTVMFADMIVGTFLIYRVVSASFYKPWKCPVCEGSGKRFYGPAFGMTEMEKMTASTCIACKGNGIVWEKIPEVNA